jgi:putative sigma-54 modulation protein
MQSRFTFKHMETSSSLIDYAKDKLVSKIEKFSTKPIEVHITFSVEAHSQHHTHVNIHGGDGFHFQIDGTSIDMYASIDLVVDKMEAQLKKRKEKLKSHKTTSHIKVLPPMEEDGDAFDKEDCDSVPVNAKDLIKYEKAKTRASGG